MKPIFKILFYLKKPKNYQTGPLPIYIRFTMDGLRSETTTGRMMEPENWNAKAGRANSKNEACRTLNFYLEELVHKAEKCYYEMTIRGEVLNPESLKNSFCGKKPKSITLVTVFEEHNEKMKSLVGKEYAPGTYERYQTCLLHVRSFMQMKYKTKDIELNRINYSFLKEFEYYLLKTRRCATNTTIKYIKNLGKIIRISLASGWITVDPYLNYKPKLQQVHREALTEEEIDRMTHKDFGMERLEIVKDIFLFSCYTGLSYVDVQKLKKSEVSVGIDGEMWIYTQRKKTDTLSRIPLLAPALDILEKYQDHPCRTIKDRLLPILSNQKMNAYLKEIATLTRIEKNLTFHIARHTFATTITLNNGVPIESVAKMMGHTSIKTTQIYAKVLDHKISADMNTLRKKLSSGKNT